MHPSVCSGREVASLSCRVTVSWSHASHKHVSANKTFTEDIATGTHALYEHTEGVSERAAVRSRGLGRTAVVSTRFTG